MKKFNYIFHVDFNEDGIDDNLCISEQSASGCKYHVNNQKELLENVLNCIADTLDPDCEYEVIVKKKKED